MPSKSDIQKIAAQIAVNLANIRRNIHSFPELGFEEKRTCHKITGLLKRIGLNQIRSPVAGTGVVGLLLGGKGKGKTVALRADIDALPIQEESNISYKSHNAGVMHACGHDAHIAMLLGAAMILKRLRGEIKGQIKFIFQPAEECLDGAVRMIRAGALARPKADAILGLHVDPELDFGTVSCKAGPIWAAADSFEIEITGRGGHAAYHFKCIDPVLVANEIYIGLRNIERSLKGTDARVISVCSIHGGTAFNIIPDRVTMKGTVRTFEKGVQATIMRRMREIVGGIASAHGAKWRINYQKGVPATVNDKRLDQLFRRVAREMGRSFVNAVPQMGGEDFSYYQQLIPGAIAKIGTRTRKQMPGLHNNRFDVDGRILPIGAVLLAKCALAWLNAYRGI